MIGEKAPDHGVIRDDVSDLRTGLPGHLVTSSYYVTVRRAETAPEQLHVLGSSACPYTSPRTMERSLAGPPASSAARREATRISLISTARSRARWSELGRSERADLDARLDPDGDDQLRFGGPSDALDHGVPELIGRDLAGDADGHR